MNAFLSFIVPAFLFFGLAQDASAEELVTVSPVFEEIVLGESREAEFEVTVENTTASALSFRVSVLDFGSLDESGGVAFLGESNALEQKYGLASWMRPEKDLLTVESNAEAKLRIRIENREDLSPGGHYAAIVFRGDTTEALAENAIGVNQVFSVLVFVKKLGGERYALEYLEEEKKNYFFMLPGTLRYRFRNAGNVHVVPRGEVRVFDPIGRLVMKGVLNEESGRILPETHRVFPVVLREVTRALVPGFYTETFSYRYDATEEQSTQEHSFFYAPMVSILFMAVLILSIVWWLRRRKTQKPETSVTTPTP